jgi:hypothetical protein
MTIKLPRKRDTLTPPEERALEVQARRYRRLGLTAEQTKRKIAGLRRLFLSFTAEEMARSAGPRAR